VCKVTKNTCSQLELRADYTFPLSVYKQNGERWEPAASRGRHEIVPCHRTPNIKFSFMYVWLLCTMLRSSCRHMDRKYLFRVVTIHSEMHFVPTNILIPAKWQAWLWCKYDNTHLIKNFILFWTGRTKALQHRTQIEFYRFSPKRLSKQKFAHGIGHSFL
jgi:hypothetical protein